MFSQTKQETSFGFSRFGLKSMFQLPLEINLYRLPQVHASIYICFHIWNDISRQKFHFFNTCFHLGVSVDHFWLSITSGRLYVGPLERYEGFSAHTTKTLQTKS